MMEELIVLVNDKNEQIGVAPKLATHNADTPLHRAFSCYVFNQAGKFLLTQRSLSKKVFPGVWTNSCCGHPAPGEKTEDAIKRRLSFELGLTPEMISVALPYFRYRAEMDGIIENEICPVYIATVTVDPNPNPLEVESYKWIDWKEFQRNISKNPGGYSYWCVKQVEQLKKTFSVSSLKNQEKDTSFKKYLEKSANEIDLYLKDYLSKWNKEIIHISSTLIPLMQVLENGCSGGKRIRGTMIKMGYELPMPHMVEGKEHILPIATAYEIFQTAILAHDDIIDKSKTRRGQLTMYRQFGDAHYGISQTISLGDLGFFMAYKSISESVFPDALKNKAIIFFSEKLIQTVLGQMLDVALSHKNSVMKITEEEVINVYKNKTAYYTFVAPLSLGAILGGADEKMVENIARFGTDIGILFQLYDDIDDIFGKHQTIKKDVGVDIQEGKMTLLYVKASHYANIAQKKVLKKYYNKADMDGKALKEIQQVFMQTKAFDYVVSVAEKYEQSAREVIPSLSQDATMQQMFHQIVDYVSRKGYKYE